MKFNPLALIIFILSGCANLPERIEDPVFGGNFPIGFGKCRNLDILLAKKDQRYKCIYVGENYKYTGEHINDFVKDGIGLIEYKDGDTYEGEWRNSEFHGQGTYKYANGENYIGEFKGGKRDGQGTYTFANGERDVGEFQNDKLNGPAIRYSANGKIIESGIYKDDVLVTSQYIDPSNFNRIGTNTALPTISDAQPQESNQVKPNSAPNVVMGKRIALVIGNAKYLSSPLRNPINDANDISSALKQSGFEVIDVRDANLQQMRSAVRTFGDRLLNSDVGLVYYSGHGIESKGRNYFIPVNTDIQRVDEIADQALDVSLILDKMTTAGKGVNILIVDACRDDPLTRSFRTTSKGLAAMDAPKGTIIAYATSPGKLASDGDPKARNSPYTKHLLAAMQVPNRPIEMVFKEVRRNVQNDTKNEQTPWENTSLSGDFYFRVQK